MNRKFKFKNPAKFANVLVAFCRGGLGGAGQRREVKKSKPNNSQLQMQESKFCAICNSGEVLDDIVGWYEFYGITVDPDTLQDWETCENCANEYLVDYFEEDAKEFALKNCKITGELEYYDTKDDGGIGLSEEYSDDTRECYTWGYVLAINRHCNTNYEELIKELSRESGRDQAYYQAIRSRIDELVEAAMVSRTRGL